jgi:cell division protein FtsX
MDLWTITLISLVAGLVLVIGGALVVYMGSLVKSAYQLKIEIKADMDEGLRKIEEDTDKKSRWIKRDLIEEIDKIKGNVTTDNQRKFAELADTLSKRLTEAEDIGRHDRAEIVKLIEGLRRDVTTLDQRIRSLRRDQTAKPGELAAEGEAATAAPPPKADARPPTASPGAAPPALPPPSEAPVSASPVGTATSV